ncbi:hypothetical protein [Enterococcus faecium]|uniref:Uncharacterized protein n=1 Tax=Enterococcus faecium TaxID=1352 RepID=A0A242B0E6_ENTFC|nr:hypothetical protein [Enterococcus faecium]OTN86789.1 hypothetical protein A5810_002912 [Enterococcus faecium]OTN86812.1 hypothetical protein A5810_002882 [Enterococcus faecium]
MEKGIADIAKVKRVLKQSSIKDLTEGTGIPKTTISSLKSGARQVEKLNLVAAIKLTEYADQVFEPIIEIWGQKRKITKRKD